MWAASCVIGSALGRPDKEGDDGVGRRTRGQRGLTGAGNLVAAARNRSRRWPRAYGSVHCVGPVGGGRPAVGETSKEELVLERTAYSDRGRSRADLPYPDVSGPGLCNPVR